MYIEQWQIFFLATIAIATWFTWRKAYAEGMSKGMTFVITDLARKGVIAIATNENTGEIVVGRYDEVDVITDVALEEEEDNEFY